MTRPAPRQRGFRLVDGVILGAVGLLALKGVSLLTLFSGPELGPDGLPAFAHVLSHARQNYVPADPTTTGTLLTPPKDGAPTGPDAHLAPGVKAFSAPESEADPGGATPAGAAPGAGSPAQRAINERLGERREELEKRTREMEARQRLLEDAERRLDARAGQVRTEEERQADAREGGPAAENAALRPIVTIYETMKPKDAARVFERLPQDVLVSVVRRINPRKMAEILAAMSPDSAQRLTVALARPSRPGDDHPAPAGGLPQGELPSIDPPAASPAAAAGPVPAAGAPAGRS